jgi:hypothetical protein
VHCTAALDCASTKHFYGGPAHVKQRRQSAPE